MMPTIRNVKPLPDYFLEIVWADGGTSVLSFRDIIAKGGIFARLSDPDFFARVEVGDCGDCLSWTGELDFEADSLWYRAHPETPIEELAPTKG
jgi:Protein of unknown function (DUF2442)